MRQGSREWLTSRVAGLICQLEEESRRLLNKSRKKRPASARACYTEQRADSLEHKNMAGEFAAGLQPSTDTAPSPQPDGVGSEA